MKEKTTESKPGWNMSVRTAPTIHNISYPVFEWSYGFKDGIRGGELRVWISSGIFVFEDRRHPIEMPQEGWKFDSVEKALAKIEDEYGWGKPPHINEVFQDIIEVRKKFPMGSKEEAEKIFGELQKKWEGLLTTAVA